MKNYDHNSESRSSSKRTCIETNFATLPMDPSFFFLIMIIILMKVIKFEDMIYKKILMYDNYISIY